MESYLDRRLTIGTYTADNKLIESEMRNLITNATPLPLLYMGAVKGFEERATFQVTYKSVLSSIQKLAKSSNIGFRIRPDFNNKQMVFETYKGLDRTINQAERNRVIFSETYGNISDATFTRNSTNYKTKVYVGGEGEGDARTIVPVGGGEGFDLHEEFYGVTDVSSEGITQAEYIGALTQKGLERLEYDSMIESFECKTDANANFVYKQNYDLGDVVTIRKADWGIATNLKITELTEVYEYGSMTVSPTFGNPLPSTIDWKE